MLKTKIKFSINIYVEREPGGWHAFCPQLEGVHIDAKTQREAVALAAKAVVLQLQTMLKYGDSIPLNKFMQAEITPTKKPRIRRFNTDISVQVPCRI